MNDPTVADLLDRGRSTLPRDLAGHIAAGAGDESTVDANIDALSRHRLIPTVARGVGRPDLTCSIIGVDLALPIVAAPMGPLELIHPDGATAVARGALAANAACVVALTSAPVFSEVAAVGAPTIAQLYWWGDRSWLTRMVDRIESAGCAGITVTVDVPDYGKRRRDLASGFDHHDQMALPNLADAPSDRSDRLAHQASLTWDDLEWFCSITDLPVAIKGILSPGDARRAVAGGAGAVYVSNHGGRALGGQVGTVEVLGEVVDAVDGAAPVIVDGGFRSAQDMCVAFALGADAVALGRPVAWALAADGSDGVARLFDLLAEDLRTALTVLGSRRPSELSRRHIRRT